MMRGTIALSIAWLLAGCVDGEGMQERGYFEGSVAPILAQKCVASGCHSATSSAGALDLTSYAAITARRDLLTPYNGSDYPLLLIKAVGPGALMDRAGKPISVLHAGGAELDVGSEAFDVLEQWIGAGATE